MNKITDKLTAYIKESEPALVVGYFDAFKTLLFSVIIFSCLGKIFDMLFNFYHALPVGVLSTYDLDNMDKAYNMWKYFLIIPLTVVLLYIINYANFEKNNGQ